MQNNQMTMDDKKAMLAHISHDIRTPMNAIVSFSGLALQSDNIEMIKSYLLDIQKASRELMQIVNANLDGAVTMGEGACIESAEGAGCLESFSGGYSVGEKLDRQAKILVVDDNALNIKVACALLEQYQLHPDVAFSGLEAIRKASSKQYQLIFMDYMMPEMDGKEAMKQIRNCTSFFYEDVPVIALTANAVAGSRETMLAEGFDDYLSKPIDKNVLEALLVKWIPGSEHFSGMMDGIDMQAGITNCGGDLEIYHTILQLVVDIGNEKKEELSGFLEREDYDNYTIAVHALKSTLANIGATQQAEMARKLEFAGKDGQYDIIRQEHGKLMQEYDKVLYEAGSYLENVLQEKSGMGCDSPEDIEESISMDEIKILLSDVKVLLKKFSYEEAGSVLSGMLEFHMEPSIKQQLQILEKQIDNFQLEEALELVHVLTEE